LDEHLPLLFYWKINNWGYYTAKISVINLRLINCLMREIIIVEELKDVLNARYF
jgi:hypothetical protein